MMNSTTFDIKQYNLSLLKGVFVFPVRVPYSYYMTLLLTEDEVHPHPVIQAPIFHPFKHQRTILSSRFHLDHLVVRLL